MGEREGTAMESEREGTAMDVTTMATLMTAGPEMPTNDAVAALVGFADECRARGDPWLERLALQEAMGLARLGNRPIAALWERIDALVDAEGDGNGGR